MSSYDDKKRNTSLNLMAGRLGVFNLGDKKPIPVEGDGKAEETSLEGFQHQSTLLRYNGGHAQHDRMVFDKRRSLDRALLYSYQAATVKKVSGKESEDGFVENSASKRKVRALINPNKLKQDYDDKIISIPYEEGFGCGDVFEWEGTQTHWLIYLQDLTELAYFRGDIRKCTLSIQWLDDGVIHNTFAAIRGPVETKVNYIQKHGISVDEPNHSLNILMPKTPESLKYFQRYSKFYLSRSMEEEPNVCWRVEATDWISTPGILEITAVEYYANDDEDDLEKGIAGGLIVAPDSPNPEHIDTLIKGDVFIKPRIAYEYRWIGPNNGNLWKVDSKYPVTIEVDRNSTGVCLVKWNSSYSGEFELSYGNYYTKKIVVQSLF